MGKELNPWLCTLFINECAILLIERAKKDTRKFGFTYLNLSAEHIGYYEKLGFKYIGLGHHPWEEESRIYQIKV